MSEERDLDLTPVRGRKRQSRVTTVQRVRKLERENQQLRAAVESHAACLRSVAEVLGGLRAVSNRLAEATNAVDLNRAGWAMGALIDDHFPRESSDEVDSGGRPVLRVQAEPVPVNDMLEDGEVQVLEDTPDIDEPETDHEQDSRSSRPRREGRVEVRRPRQGPSRRRRPLLGS